MKKNKTIMNKRVSLLIKKISNRSKLYFKIIKKNKWIFLIEIFTVFVFLILPYYMFGNKMYVGGDDTKLFYSYPSEFLKNVTFFSWVNVSSIGINGPSQYIFPFLLVWTVLEGIIQNKIFLNHFAMSLPLILGQIYFLLSIKELFDLKKKYFTELYLGSLFFVTSPILIINQMFVFLLSIWLIGLIPIVVYNFIKYLKTSNFKYVYISSIYCCVFSLAMYAIPWTLGFLLPIGIGFLITLPLFKKNEIYVFLKRFIIFAGFIFITQAFWLVGFISTYISLGQNSFASKFLSKSFVDTFSPTIIVTATSSIIYPLLNLFHRQITIDFNWKLKDIFLNYYDKTIFFNSIFLIVLFIGIFNFRNYLNKQNRRFFLLLLFSFVIALYLFTVNIGFLKDVFILFRYIPGFTMFRNFFDKFAPGYVLIFASLITVSLVIFSQKYPSKRLIFSLIFFFVILLNYKPVKDVVNSPLWGTTNVYKNVEIPSEYLETMTFIRKNISPTNSVLSIPFGTSIYTVIRDENSNNVYVGLSPVKIFSGVNDISGHLSFNFTKEADAVDALIINREYEKLKEVMFKHNINYILITKNIPDQVLKAEWLYGDNLVASQDAKLINSLAKKKIFTSKKGNYELYSTKLRGSIIDSRNLSFERISQVKYKLYINNLKNNQRLVFHDTFHQGWGIFLEKEPKYDFCSVLYNNPKTKTIECKPKEELFELHDLIFSFLKPITNQSETSAENNNNEWNLSSELIKSKFGKEFYVLNKDGSIDIELTLYFRPQNYFYFGIFISIAAFLAGGGYILINKYGKR